MLGMNMSLIIYYIKHKVCFHSKISNFMISFVFFAMETHTTKINRTIDQYKDRIMKYKKDRKRIVILSDEDIADILKVQMNTNNLFNSSKK